MLLHYGECRANDVGRRALGALAIDDFPHRLLGVARCVAERDERANGVGGAALHRAGAGERSRLRRELLNLVAQLHAEALRDLPSAAGPPPARDEVAVADRADDTGAAKRRDEAEPERRAHAARAEQRLEQLAVLDG